MIEDGAALSFDDLTPRMIEILALVVNGQSNKETARRLNVAPATVRNLMTEIYRRTGCQDRAALALWASRQMTPPPDGRDLYHRIKNRLWSVRPHVCHNRKYLPAGAVDAIVKDVLLARRDLPGGRRPVEDDDDAFATGGER